MVRLNAAQLVRKSIELINSTLEELRMCRKNISADILHLNLTTISKLENGEHVCCHVFQNKPNTGRICGKYCKDFICSIHKKQNKWAFRPEFHFGLNIYNIRPEVIYDEGEEAEGPDGMMIFHDGEWLDNWDIPDDDNILDEEAIANAIAI
jgi:hypothetical protein